MMTGRRPCCCNWVNRRVRSICTSTATAACRTAISIGCGNRSPGRARRARIPRSRASPGASAWSPTGSNSAGRTCANLRRLPVRRHLSANERSLIHCFRERVFDRRHREDIAMNETASGFIARLRQRKLVQWAVAYVAFAFALVQVLDVVAESYDWPHSEMHGAFGPLALGFVIALVLAWYHGEKGRQRVSGAELLLIALVLAIGGGLLWRFERATPTTGSPDAAQRNPGTIAPDSVTGVTSSGLRGAPAAPIPAKSVAVLPLLNESSDPKQDYFSDGLSEELISARGQVRALKVIGRNSSFQFRGRAQEDTAGIGAKLGVATLLEGTVRKQGDEVRIFASLVKASDGSHLCSQTYERQLKDVFALQSGIATWVATALKANVFGAAVEATDKPPSGNLAAYDAMLQGRWYAERRNRADYFKAVDYYQQAIKLDPDYALAYARLAIAQQWFNDWVANNEVRKITGEQARANVREAVELAPQSALALGALGINQAWSDFDRSEERR